MIYNDSLPGACIDALKLTTEQDRIQQVITGVVVFHHHCVANLVRRRGRLAGQSAGCGAAKSPVDDLWPGDEQKARTPGD